MTKAHKPTGPLDPIAEQISGFFATDPTWQSMTNGGSLPEIRAGIKANMPVSGEPAMDTEDFQVPVAGGEILVRAYRPVASPRAIIVWIHGGGFALGSVHESDNFARFMAKATGCAVASVDYRLTPEHVFPTQVNDCEAAVEWVLANRAKVAGDDVPVIVGGDSAGGNLSTVVTRKINAKKAGAVVANILAYPCTDNAEAESLTRFEAPFLTLRDTSFFLNTYQPDPSGRTHPDFAPIYAADVGVLPPTLIITAEHDILTEQGDAYGEKLKDAGVKVQTTCYPGMIHGFATMDVFFDGAAGKSMQEIDGFIKATL